MDRMLYVAMTGARETMTAQAVLSNNLANISTAGFKADLSQFRSMPVFGPGEPTRVYAMSERPSTDFNPGAIRTTGRDLDVAVNRDGWIAVLGSDGTEAYTRAGDLRLGPNGLLETGAGYLVLGNGGPISVPPAETLTIGSDGTITIRPLGQAANALTQLDRIRLVNPAHANLLKGEDGLMRTKDATVAPADASVTVTSGALEGSNVNAVGALVDLIALSRKFEMQIRVMTTAEGDDEASTQMMRLA